MKILDRYIIRQFLVNFVILSVVVILLIVLIDLMIGFDEFIDAGRYRAEQRGGPVVFWTLWSIGDYYGPLIAFIYIYLSGLIVVAATGFTFVSLARSRELVTMIAGGISMYRVAVPVLGVGIAINVLTLLDQELLIPKLADKLARDRTQIQYDSVRTFAVQYAPDAKDNLFSASHFDAKASELRDVVILERDRDGRHRRRITAKYARWNDDRGGWELIDGQAISRDEVDSIDTIWLEREPVAIDFFKTDLSPSVLMLRRAAIYPALLSMNELGRLMANPAADSARLLRTMHSRFSLMVVNILILVMTLPIFLTREPPNPILQALKSAGLGIGMWMFGLGVVSFAGGLHPVVLAWLPVVILLPVSVFLVQRMKT